jgi:transposase
MLLKDEVDAVGTEAFFEARTFRNSASGSMTRNNREYTPCSAFARTVRRDLDAVTNALTEGWSNGQTEGQINRLKTLKRAIYGRAGAELLRARMLPLHLPIQHAK